MVTGLPESRPEPELVGADPEPVVDGRRDEDEDGLLRTLVLDACAEAWDASEA